MRRGIKRLLALCICGWVASAWADGAVAFLSPKNRAIALGPTEIELTVQPPAGATVEQVDLLVDGRPTAGWTDPPFRFTWDAGEGEESHILTGQARFSDGSSARAVIVTSKLIINQVEKVDLVNLYVMVRDPKGNHVKDLQTSDFRVYEDDVPQTVQRFTAEPKPLSVGIVLDTSQSMDRRGRLETAQRSATEFLRALDPFDRVMLVSFNDEVEVRQELSDDHDVVRAAIRSTQPNGGTALYDAIYRAADRLDGQSGRRVMVVLTDGRDEAANGLEPGSLHTLEEALNRALRAETMIFAIGLGKDLKRLDFFGRETHEEILVRTARATGGRVVLSSGAAGLKAAFREVEDDLRHQYTIAYQSTNRARDGSWRRVRIEVPGRPDLSVVARQGYYANSGKERKLDRAIPVGAR